MSANSRLAQPEDLARINARSVTANYNRQLSAETIGNLDSQGISIVTDLLVHEHAAGYRVAPHLRTRVLMKVKGSQEPLVGYLDMTFEDFESLPLARRMLDDVQDEVRFPSEV